MESTKGPGNIAGTGWGWPAVLAFFTLCLVVSMVVSYRSRDEARSRFGIGIEAPQSQAPASEPARNGDEAP